MTANAGIDPSVPSLQISTAGHAPRKDSSSSTNYAPDDKGKKLVYRSILSQQVPVDGLKHLEADHPGHVIKRFLMDRTNGLVDKLREMVPPLDDHVDSKGTRDALDEMEDVVFQTIVRNWFRRIILARGQPGVLDLASRHTTIMGFLRSGVEVEELRKYVEYFENIDVNALRHLRRAASDSFSNQNRPTITLLGGSVSTDDGLEQLSTEQWDIVFGGFNNVIPWYLVPSFSISFAENLYVSKLLSLNRYGEEWLPEESPLRDSAFATILDFMVSTQGFCDPPIPKIAAEGRGFRETEYRNYVAGRMDIRDLIAERLFLELKKRTRSCLFVVWKGAELEKTHFQSEEDIFIH